MLSRVVGVSLRSCVLKSATGPVHVQQEQSVHEMRKVFGSAIFHTDILHNNRNFSSMSSSNKFSNKPMVSECNGETSLNLLEKVRTCKAITLSKRSFARPTLEATDLQV